jgi:AmmeMemoRadiSam system protein A
MKNQDSSANITEKQGQILVGLARHTIFKKLTAKSDKKELDFQPPELMDEIFQAHCGTFVTLKIQGQLRGCIGNLTATESVLESVKSNAINAAFHDPRFASLTAAELERTKIEVSILTKPRRLEYGDSQDLIQKLRVNVDGVILRKDRASATFLPQVWEQLPRPEDFLSHLCQKAGLSPEAWKRTELEVLTYQVQSFEEGHKS